MNASKPQPSARQPGAIKTSLEGNSLRSWRGEGTAAPKSRDEAGAERAGETIAALVQKVGSSSIAGIEKLVGLAAYYCLLGSLATVQLSGR